jgi:hypothetical protein
MKKSTVFNFDGLYKRSSDIKSEAASAIEAPPEALRRFRALEAATEATLEAPPKAPLSANSDCP